VGGERNHALKGKVWGGQGTPHPGISDKRGWKSSQIYSEKGRVKSRGSLIVKVVRWYRKTQF